MEAGASVARMWPAGEGWTTGWAFNAVFRVIDVISQHDFACYNILGISIFLCIGLYGLYVTQCLEKNQGCNSRKTSYGSSLLASKKIQILKLHLNLDINLEI